MAISGPTACDSDTQPSEARSTLARVLAPEEVRPGDYVALLDEVYEFPSFWWCADTTLFPPTEIVRLRFTPRDESRPLKVLSACLPFVLTKQPTGERRTLDLRRHRLARLDQDYAATAWKAYKKNAPSKR